jgi:DNA-binding transcriptional MerR regulator
MKDQSAIIKIGEVARLLKMDVRSVRNMVDNGTIKTLPGETKTRLFSRSYILRLIDGVQEKCPHCGKKL